MKKQGILNSDISKVLSDMGHTDLLVIADCGLPIPATVKKIDLALKPGLPSFLETLAVVLEDFEVEQAIIAEEMIDENTALYDKLPFHSFPIDSVSHEELKLHLSRVRAVIRTGEATPYANIMLKAGVIFS
ncbi:D-ribose pyranase [Bacillus fonticola]|uniref:D-ribose pyranase n=1 Tax=Bacillus fonticola TaxID=2728853 RepID=UPI0014727F2E|nr:D-ribose pyranase [Bacillus fonticola]